MTQVLQGKSHNFQDLDFDNRCFMTKKKRYKNEINGNNFHREKDKFLSERLNKRWTI